MGAKRLRPSQRPWRLQLADSAGFTLTEVMLVIAIMSVLAAIGTPIYLALQNRNELDVATNVLVQDLYRAQSNSRDSAGDSGWGVAINGSNIVLFRGNNFASRNAALDESYAVPSVVQMTGSSELDYAKLTGWPTATGTFTLTAAGSSRTVSVNSKGMVEY